MSYLVLARKYRPQTFDEMVGQKHVTQTLVNAIAADRMAHAILFSGPRGTGKTTVARILAKAMNCAQGPTPEPCNACRSCREITVGSSVDVFEIDGASNNGVDHVRDLRENVKYKPAFSPFKIYIIDEVHMLSMQAFNALLKTLEEPPAHVMFLFATTEPHKIPITILSRCQRHDFRRISWTDISTHMAELCRREEASVDEESLAIIAREAGGSMRDALSLLDQVVACTSGAVTAEVVLAILGTVDRNVIFELSRCAIGGDFPSILDTIGDIYSRGHNIKELYSDLVDHFRNLVVVKMGQQAAKLIDLPAHEIARMKEQVEGVSTSFLNLAFDVLFSAEASIKLSDQPRLALELAFLKMLTLKPALPIEFLIEKIDDLRQSLGRHVDVGIPSGGQTAAAKPETGATVPHPMEAPVAASQETATGGPFEGEGEAVWGEFIEAVADNHPSLTPHLEVCSLADLTEDCLVIEINGNSFNGSMLRRKKNLDNLKQVARRVFGKPMTVHFNAKGKRALSLRKQKGRENELKNTALMHPLVNDAIEIFNGHVIEVKILNEKEVAHERHGEHAQTGPETSNQNDENAGGAG